MSFFSADLESMVDLYQRETAELMEEFDARQAKAMQQNRLSAEDINAVFRVVHTIKSSAAMMGLADISTATHRMEDFFLLLRDDPTRMQGHENPVFDLMYLFSDYVQKENRRVSQKGFVPTGASTIVSAIDAQIEALGAGGKSADAQEPKSAVGDKTASATMVQQVRSSDVDVDAEGEELVWRVTLQPNCQMENVRAYMLIKQLSGYCSRITTDPADLELPDAAAQIISGGLLLAMRTTHRDEVARRLSSSPYVARVEDVGREEGRETEDEPDGEDEERASEDDILPNRQNRFSMVSWSHVMRLQDITGELITANTLLTASLKDVVRGGELGNELQTMKRLFHDLEKSVAAISMMPVSSATPQYYRLVREVATREGKQIRLDVVGEDLEVDRNLLDALGNPLVHLLRNAADHGIEEPEVRIAAGKDRCGTITLTFENLTDRLHVTVQDDGAGIDRPLLLKKAQQHGILTKDPDQYDEQETLNLIFTPGFSTNENTNRYSGRGVGMDVVSNVATELGGGVTVNSTFGRGTSIMMEVPVSVTSAECIRFAVGSCVCLIPIRCVVHIYSYDEMVRHLSAIDGKMWAETADGMLPVLDLFDLYEEKGEESGRRLVVIRDATDRAVLLTGPISGQQTAVEKPLPPLLGHAYRDMTGIIGCAVTETGKLGMMLNADWLIHRCGQEVSREG